MTQNTPVQTRIEINAFGHEHIDGALALSRGENWPHRREDWLLAHHLSKGVVAVDPEGRVVGTLMMTPYGDTCGTINMVIVDKAMRGLGLGRRMMESAIALAGDRQLRLIATQEGLPLYEKLGFVAIGAVRQHQGPVTTLARPDGIEVLQPDDLAAIQALDTKAFGANRTTLIEALHRHGEIAVVRKDHHIIAYAAIRAFGRGEVIGPVVAPDLEMAKTLIAYHAASRPGAFLRVDTDIETGLHPFLSEIGLAHAGGGVTMQRPPKAGADDVHAKLYALASQALG
ncbi:GNAT family N-acetyltransferase [Allorhizobium sp. BGMRC 0089]|uniref:GNAT family N-acetyltransferase n=1 Tax=Allorhizobium sonneratiae TaxID=2934936 RepID=UPI002033D191|nr:GNAT family N-acetyltransferase [Allorhizobium sonneratiae]MCM2292693.1 GNAT family N-acetyltransferase [Allorhizobium sonneratiae]